MRRLCLLFALLALSATVSPAARVTAAQDRLNAYLTRHMQSSGSAGVASYARVVSLEGEQER